MKSSDVYQNYQQIDPSASSLSCQKPLELWLVPYSWQAQSSFSKHFNNQEKSTQFFCQCLGFEKQVSSLWFLVYPLTSVVLCSGSGSPTIELANWSVNSNENSVPLNWKWDDEDDFSHCEMEIFHHQTSRLQATQKALEQPFKEVSNFASVESTKELLLSLKNPQRWENVVHYTVGKITIT